ncbi:MAG: tetratricopeptide repeat protein [Acidobacteriia bacterium]|nr:tetratricopeptide repeat protein [Terriglobia bacterium]
MESKEDLYEQGVSLALEDKYAEAVERYRKALEIDPKYADVWHAVINAYSAMNELDQGIEAAKQLIAIAPDDILAHSSLSMLYMKKGMKKEAEDEGAVAKVLGFRDMMKQTKTDDEMKKID